MESLEENRAEFRRYLECSGVIDKISKALLKLYEEPNKPENPTLFIREQMCDTCGTEEQYETLKQCYDSALSKISTMEREISSLKGNIKRTASEISLILEKGMSLLEEDENCNSLLKKYLTREIFEALKTLETSFKSTLLDCIQTGFVHHDSGVGIYASDPEAYTVFADLFDPIIEEYHGGFKKCDIHPPLDWGDPLCLGDLDPDNTYIISTRVRCGRTIEGYPFNPKMSEADYLSVEKMIKSATEGLDEEYKGKYYSLQEMTPETKTKLINNHFLFKECDKYLEAANATRFWPVGRGIYINDMNTFLIWVNEEDHIRIIALEAGGDLAAVYNHLAHGVEKLSEILSFNRNERLGHLTFCPTNLGTSIRASVLIKLPKLIADFPKLQELADKFNLQIRGTYGEHTESDTGIYDISNKRRLGLTEFQAVKELYDGVKQIICIEREMT